MPILYGVTIIEQIHGLPRRVQTAKGIPGGAGWAAWPGWSVSVETTRVTITQEPIALTETQGIPEEARDELTANDPEEKQAKLRWSIPLNFCILHYVEGTPADKASGQKSPTPALLKLLEERKKAPKPVGPPPGVPVSAYQGPPVTPMRAMQRGPQPPGSVRPEAPPPSIILPDEPEVA